jgi:transcription factor SPT20
MIFYILTLLVKTDGYILKKFRGQPPSLIVHLYQAHFKFENQPTTFTYKSPMRVFIESLKSRTIPHDMLEHLEQADVRFYAGKLMCRSIRARN